MLRIGLTGSIATGKSTVLDAFSALGVPVYSADAAVHELYSGEAVPAIETLFPGVIRDGVVDRAALGQHLANAPDRVAELESIIHPLVREKAYEFFDMAEAQGSDIAVIEVPLLYETGSKYPVDYVIVTHCPATEQKRRAMARPGMTEEKFALMLGRQIPQDEKIARADFTVDTGGTIVSSREQVAQILQTLRAQAE